LIYFLLNHRVVFLSAQNCITRKLEADYRGGNRISCRMNCSALQLMHRSICIW